MWIEDGSIELRLDWFLVRSIQYNPLNRDAKPAPSKQQQQQQFQTSPRRQQGQYTMKKDRLF
jgi:hypothetical protein